MGNIYHNGGWIERLLTLGEGIMVNKLCLIMETTQVKNTNKMKLKTKIMLMHWVDIEG